MIGWATTTNNDKPRVLVVDDEQDITTIVRLGLRKFGFDADVFNDPKLALSQFKPNYYKAIILDVRMPGISGFTLAKEIWAIDPDARICFLSSFEIYEHEAKFVFTNFKSHCFVKKPIAPAELAKHIQGHLVTA